MKRLIGKTLFFTSPFFLLYFLNLLFFKQDQGDLVRIGYLYSNPLQKKVIAAKFHQAKKYVLFSQLEYKSASTFDVATLGDSFSSQDSLGYNNYLANKNLSVLDLNEPVNNSNIVQKLIALTNGDFFDSVKIKYIVLESVEREIVGRCEDIDYNETICFDSIQNELKDYKRNQTMQPVNFFSDATLKIPLTNILYNYTDKPEYSKTFKVTANTNQLFSNNPDNLLFYQYDIYSLNYKNDSSKIRVANDALNMLGSMLSQKSIHLIVLICPDKYDLYYPFIKDKTNYKTPLFFSYFNNMKKEYLYVDAYKILSAELRKQKDIYYYDDTHWSPKAAEIIAEEIKKLIDNDSTDGKLNLK